MRFLNLWWVPFGFAALFVLFLYNALISWNVGLVWGGESVMLATDVLPFQFEKNFTITSGHFLAAVFVVFAFFQFLVFSEISNAWEDGDAKWLLTVSVIALGLMGLSVFTAMAYQSSQTELTFRKAEALKTRWENNTVTLDHLYKKTQVDPPRSAAVIGVEMEGLLKKVVRRTRKQALTLGALTRSCARPTKSTQKHCDRYFKLKLEHAQSVAYEARSKQIIATEGRQTTLMRIDPAAYFTLFKDITGVSEDRQKTGRLLWFILLNELVTLFGMTLLRRMISKSFHGKEKQSHTNPLPPETVAESVPESVDESEESLTAAIEASGGKVTRITQPNISAKERSLVEYMRFTGPRDWQDTKSFMCEYKRWCAQQGRSAMGRNYVGNVIVRYGGERRRTYIKKEGQNDSGRILWKVNALVMPDEVKQARKAA